MKKILVTGGAGFIGSHVVDELIKSGKQVIVLDDLSGGFKENVNKKAKFIKGSITDYTLVKSIFKNNQIEYVFHLAAYAAEGLSHFIKRFNYENNLIGSVNLINCAVNYNVKCFVFTSSIAVYGKNQLPMREDMIPVPEDSYGIAKLAVEQELEASHKMFGLDYIIFRPHNVYGEKQNIGDKYRNVIGIFMNQIMHKKPMSIFGDGTQSRAFSYVGDVAPIMVDSIANKNAYNKIFNIGADKPYSVKELAERVALVMGTTPKIKYLEGRNEVLHAYSDHSKLQKVFKYKARFDLNEGLKRMAQWAKKTGSKESKKFSNIEIIKNLPKSWRGK
ncbi:MAG: NAD-dependent epimerase/dehydratase family protein [bacterium]|nr:NAD-dependent epimerase/dehydratase family protein [bacterium]